MTLRFAQHLTSMFAICPTSTQEWPCRPGGHSSLKDQVTTGRETSEENCGNTRKENNSYHLVWWWKAEWGVIADDKYVDPWLLCEAKVTEQMPFLEGVMQFASRFVRLRWFHHVHKNHHWEFRSQSRRSQECRVMDYSLNSSAQSKCPLAIHIILRCVNELILTGKGPCEIGRLPKREMLVKNRWGRNLVRVLTISVQQTYIAHQFNSTRKKNKTKRNLRTPHKVPRAGVNTEQKSPCWLHSHQPLANLLEEEEKPEAGGGCGELLLWPISLLLKVIFPQSLSSSSRCRPPSPPVKHCWTINVTAELQYEVSENSLKSKN